MNNLSSSALAYQIGGSKQCLESHGIKSPNWFAAKYGDVWNNATVVNAISKYYQFADDGSANLMFLEVEVKDDTKDNSYDAVGLATYSNSESTVWTHASIFETLLRQTQISDAQKIEQKT